MNKPLGIGLIPITLSLLVTLGLGSVLAAADHHILAGDGLPEGLAGNWQRLGDGAQFPIRPGESLAELPAGLYQVGGERVFLRQDDSLPGHALSLVGLRTLKQEELPLREQLAEHLIAVDQLSLVIASWRLADGLPWPWVDHGDRVLGLPRYAKRLNPTKAGFAFDAEQACYVDTAGRALPIAGTGPLNLVCGDLLAAIDPSVDEAHWGSLGILVEDRGVIGSLDPADIVVCCQYPDGRLLPTVVRQALGTITSPTATLHIYRQRPGMAEELAAYGGPKPPIDPENPIWGLPRWRQGLALVGMALICLVLLRNLRRHRKKNKG